MATTPRNQIRKVLFLLAAVVLVVTGCRDSLVSPDVGEPHKSFGEMRAMNCEGSAEGGYICDPIVGGGGPGAEPPPPDDPGNCNINTGQNCDNHPGTGGGGDGGGTGGSGGEGSPMMAPAHLSNDFVTDTIPPNCNSPSSSLERAACSATTPQGTWLQRTLDALDRIEQRGEPCASIARQGRQFIANGMLKYYSRQPGLSGGYGNSVVGVLLESLWVTEVYNRKDSYGRNLDWGLVHEIEHANGVPHSHTDSWGVEHTPNDTRCAG